MQVVWREDGHVLPCTFLVVFFSTGHGGKSVDGKLLAAVGKSGLVQVFDLKKQIPLRQLCGHSRSVRLVRYPGLDKLHLFSGGDDALVKFWDCAVRLGNSTREVEGFFKIGFDGFGTRVLLHALITYTAVGEEDGNLAPLVPPAIAKLLCVE
uniref:Uncharacterized protein n=1 Tax=Nelumbo nucifera TaxID=4432 RepID=A0A822YV07_NELNU|nr:TPA_asm: hypothetical protein HUJ06_007001 [Nelumbo nucifera]